MSAQLGEIRNELIILTKYVEGIPDFFRISVSRVYWKPMQFLVSMRSVKLVRTIG